MYYQQYLGATSAAEVRPRYRMMHRQLGTSTLNSPLYSRRPLKQMRSPLRCNGTQSSAGERMQARENWQLFWERYKTTKPSNMSGWVGKFVSYAPTGAGEEDVRFQDIWLRAFQERGENGRFHMKMIRRADQEAKSWPRAGRERSDGNDETVLDGTEEDSSFPAGFWHPYGRGNDQLPPSRVVCLSSEAIAQVTLQFPTVDAVMSAQEWDFMGSSEITFISGGKRAILTVTYKGGGGGSILFHQASWDPIFLENIDPEAPLDLPQLLSDKKQGPPLPAEIPRWPIKEGAEGTAVTLRFTKEDETWDWLPEAAVSFSPPDTSGQVLYKYSNGMYGLYPKTIGADGCLSFEAGVLLEDGCFWRYCARYHEDRSLDTIQWQRFAPGG